MDNNNRDYGKKRYMDPASELYNAFIIKIEGEVNDQMASNVTAQLQQLAQLDPNKTIEMQVNTGGGSVIAGLAIYDMMRKIPNKIRTVGIGMQASMGSILLAAGDERYMTPNASLMIHQIASQAQGKASDNQVNISYSHKLHDMLKTVYVRHIGLTAEFWDVALERDSWLNPDQALKMGFIHGITPVHPSKKTAYDDEADKLLGDFNRKAASEVPTKVEEIEKYINQASAKRGKYADMRPELVTALSQFPKYWTKGKKAEMKKKATANDNKGAKLTPVALKRS